MAKPCLHRFVHDVEQVVKFYIAFNVVRYIMVMLCICSAHDT